jgi:hypothetical protein
LGWGIFSLFFKQNASEPGTMWCFGCRLVFYKVYIVGLLACSKWDDGVQLPCLRQIGWAFTWSGRSGQCECIFARYVSKRMWLMSHLCFVCAPHVPAW